MKIGWVSRGRLAASLRSGVQTSTGSIAFSDGSSVRVAGGREPPVKIVGGADQRKMREGLREVAEVLRSRTQFLAVKPQVVRVAEHLLKEEPCLWQVAPAGQTLDIPERAHRECALLTADAVG